MTGLLLGLEIRDNYVAAAVGRRSGKSMMFVRGARCEVGERTLAEALQQVMIEVNYPGGECHLVIGAELLSYRSLTLPFGDRRKIAQVLQFELAERTIHDMDEVELDFLVTGQKGNMTTILAVLLPHPVLDRLLEATASADLQPKSLGISGLTQVMKCALEEPGTFAFLHCGSAQAALFIVDNGRLQVIRSVQLVAGKDPSTPVDLVQQTVAQTIIAADRQDLFGSEGLLYIGGDRQFQEALQQQMATVFDRVVVYEKLGGPLGNSEMNDSSLSDSGIESAFLALQPVSRPIINFMRSDFEPFSFVQEHGRAFSLAGILFFLLCIGGSVYMGRDYRLMSTQNDELKQQIENVFRQTVPEVTRIADPVRQLQIINGEIKKASHPGGEAGQTMISLLTELSRRIGPDITVQLRRVVADNSVVRLSGFTKDFNMVDKVQRQLEKSPLFTKVEISSANQSAQGEEVRFEIKMELAGR